MIDFKSKVQVLTHNCVVTDVNHNASGSSFNCISWEESKVLGLKGVFMSVFRASALWFRLASQWRVVNLEATGLQNSDVYKKLELLKIVSSLSLNNWPCNLYNILLKKDLLESCLRIWPRWCHPWPALPPSRSASRSHGGRWHTVGKATIT